MSSKDNQAKAQHGINAKKSLSAVVEELERYGALREHENNPSFGYAGHDDSQFKADKIVTTFDGSKDILYSTNSIRSDRVKGQQWDAYHIKKIDKRVEHAYIVIPGLDSVESIDGLRKKIRNGEMYSAIDDIWTADEYYENEVSRYGGTLSNGVRHDLEGREFQNLFCSILNSQENLNRFNEAGDDVGHLYGIYYKVISFLGFGQKEIKSIAATTDIPKLSSGGNPKTDVAATVTLKDDTKQLVTFSLKDSSSNKVSVHQYTADAFADVLDPQNTRLRELLREFQNAHNVRDMPKGTPEELKNELKPYLSILDRWVFSGVGAKGVLPIQLSLIHI